MILILAYVLLSLAIITVVARLYSRSSLRHGLRADDFTVVASLVNLQADYLSDTV